MTLRQLLIPLQGFPQQVMLDRLSQPRAMILNCVQSISPATD